jgi:hypothetical protein
MWKISGHNPLPKAQLEKATYMVEFSIEKMFVVQ